MSPRATSALTVASVERNEKLTSTRLVSFEQAFFRALSSRLRVADGSVYEAEPATVNLVERVNAWEVPFEVPARSEEHTSELQSHVNLVCRLLLEKKKKQK